MVDNALHPYNYITLKKSKPRKMKQHLPITSKRVILCYDAMQMHVFCTFY